VIGVLFLIVGIAFSFIVLKAYTSKELKARGWGFSIRTYRREDEPIKYWITFYSYLVIALWAMVFGVLLVYKSFS
jgi:hypothetical protein